MSNCWLANAHPAQAWADRAWPEFARLAKAGTTIILPVHGFAATEGRGAYDQEELTGGEWLRQGAHHAGATTSLLVLPPLRFCLAPHGAGLLGLDPDTTLQLLREIAASVHAAGFGKLVFFNTSPCNEPVVATAAVDARAEFGLRTYVIQARALGFAPGALPPDPAALALLADLLREIAGHKRPLRKTPRRADRPRPALPPATTFPAYRHAYLPALSPQQLGAIPAKAQTLIILPTAAIEQHGYHLPVGVDAVLGQALLTAALPHLSGRMPCYLAPPITYGKSNEHTGFAGTVSLSAATLRRLLLALGTRLRDLGFRRLAVFNTHGGNSAVLQYVLPELRDTLGLDARLLRHGFKPDVAPQEAAWGFHADEWETSLMLACAPESVHLDQAVCEYPAYLDDPGRLRPERAPATYAWLTRDLSKSGVIGDATAATAEKGQRWLAAAARSLADQIVATCH